MIEMIDAQTFTRSQGRAVGALIHEIAWPWLFVWTIGAPLHRRYV